MAKRTVRTVARRKAPRTSLPVRKKSPADSVPSKLSPTQEQALQHLSAGTSICDAAHLVGVNRKTIHRWLADDAHFAAAYNAWRQEMVDSGRARVLAMSDLALTAVRNAIKGGDARIALQVARSSGAMDAARSGPTDPQRLQRRRDLRDRGRELAMDARENELRLQVSRQNQDNAWMKDVDELENLIDWFLKLRREAFTTESPEARDKRLDKRKHYDPYQKTRRLLELADAAADSHPPASFQPTTTASALSSADLTPQAPPARPASLPAPGATDAPVTDSAIANRQSARAAPGTPSSTGSDPSTRTKTLSGVEGHSAPVKTQVRPVRAIAYDGSDESDNDPLWEKIG